MNIYFSVIVPVYNKVSTISRCLKSVLEQSYQDFELIIVDDASTDGSREKIQSINDQRIRRLYRDVPGPGGYAARNYGIQKARGSWICFLDADDEWCKNHLYEVHDLTVRYSTDLVSTSWFDSWGAIVKKCAFAAKYKKKKELVINFDQFLLLSSRGRSPVHTNVIAIRRGFLSEKDEFPSGIYNRGGDVMTWAKLISKADKIVCTSLVTSYYHRNDSMVTKITHPQVENNPIFHFCRKKLTKASDVKKKINLKKFSNYHIFHGLIYCISIGELTVEKCNYYYFTGNPVRYLLLLVYAFFPSSIQKKIWHFYQRIK